MASFQIENNHYCVSDHYASTNRGLQNSEIENKLYAIVNQIEDLIPKQIYLSQAITPEFLITNKFTSSLYLNVETENILLIQIAIFYQVHKGSLHYDPPELMFILEISKKLLPNEIYEGNAFDKIILLKEDESYEIIFKHINSFTIATNICTGVLVNLFHENYYCLQPYVMNGKDLFLNARLLGRFQLNLLQDKEYPIKHLDVSYLEYLQKPFSDSINIYIILFQTFLYLNVFIYFNQPSDEKDVESQNSEQQSMSEISDEVFSDYTYEFSGSTMIEEDIFINSENNTIVYSNLSSEMDQNSFYLNSQGESLEEEDQIPKNKEEKVVEKRNQVNVNQFQRVKFTIPEGCWGIKDPIFLPQDPDEEMVDNKCNQRLE